MKDAEKNIFPVFDQLLQRVDKEALLQQKARVIWLTGLSGSGKTTLAKGLERALHEKGFMTQLLDGDNVRTGINNNLGFSEEDRQENIRRISEVAKLFLNCGVITISSFVSPTRAIRQTARDIVGSDSFFEVHVSASLEVCESRDVKGLYAKARAGEIKQFTGIDAPYEEPEAADLVIDTGAEDFDISLKKLTEHILPLIQQPA